MTSLINNSFIRPNIINSQGDCAVNLVGAVPDYQGKNKCNYDKVTGLTFSAAKCGVYFNFTHWNESQVITVHGRSDQKVNVRPRVMSLRLYVEGNKSSSDQNLKFWNGYMLPELKVYFH